MSVVEIHGKIEAVQTLPESDSPVDLSKLDSWEELIDEQKLFLCAYFVMYPKRLAARMKTGITQSMLTKWIKQDRNFGQAFEDVEELHKENLSALHYQDAYEDSRARKDVLKGIGARGYDSSNSKTNTTNILNVGDKDTIQDLLKKYN